MQLAKNAGELSQVEPNIFFQLYKKESTISLCYFFITFKQWESHPGCTSCCWSRRQLSFVLRFRSWPPVHIIIQGSPSREKHFIFCPHSTSASFSTLFGKSYS